MGGEQGRRDSNPQPSVLETGALPVELLPSVDRHAANGQPIAGAVRQVITGGRRIPRRGPVNPGPGPRAVNPRPGPTPSRRRLWPATLDAQALSGLLVQRVLAVPPAELLHLDPLAVVELVLGGDVVPSFALLAGQGDLDALVILCHGDSSCPPPAALAEGLDPMPARCPETYSLS